MSRYDSREVEFECDCGKKHTGFFSEYNLRRYKQAIALQIVCECGVHLKYTMVASNSNSVKEVEVDVTKDVIDKAWNKTLKGINKKT